MPNDDLGTFPMPPQTPSAPADPVVSDPQTSITPPSTPPSPVSDTPPVDIQSETPPASPAFEETPEEIPSIQNTAPTVNIADEQEKLVMANEDLIEKQSAQEIPVPEPVAETVSTTPPTESPAAAALPSKVNRQIAPIIIVVLLVVAGIGLAAAAFLSAQSKKLKAQLEDITQTLEKQQTTLTPTPTPTVFQIPTPTIATQSAIATPSASPTSTPTSTPTPTISITSKLQPLSYASSILKVAINHSPNAQLLLVKVDNATDTTTAVTKYFFRVDTTTKKYFYVAITGKGNPEIIDKSIYVTPDDNIPSLNDNVLGNKMGIDLDEAMKITYSQCANQTTCSAAPVKAQYIKTSTGIIWQLSLYTNGLSSSPLLIQINAETKVILYKSPEFANK